MLPSLSKVSCWVYTKTLRWLTLKNSNSSNSTLNSYLRVPPSVSSSSKCSLSLVGWRFSWSSMVNLNPKKYLLHLADWHRCKEWIQGDEQSPLINPIIIALKLYHKWIVGMQESQLQTSTTIRLGASNIVTKLLILFPTVNGLSFACIWLNTIIMPPIGQYKNRSILDWTITPRLLQFNWSAEASNTHWILLFYSVRRIPPCWLSAWHLYPLYGWIILVRWAKLPRIKS